MATSQEPRRRLPADPSPEYLRKQAKRLAKSDALQLAAAQRRLAADYGYASWAALMRAVQAAARSPAAGGPSPLASAAVRADALAVRELLARGEPADGGDNEINTPLWLACGSEAPAERRMAVVELLLDAGASPRRACEGNSTALHMAARSGPLALVELLIRRGALSWQGDRRGKTALDYARKGQASDREQIIELLDRPVIRNVRFRAAVKAIHTGDVVSLCRLLDQQPELLRERAVEPECYPRDYFRDPKLFWFIANNPTLMRKVPRSMVEIGQAMIARGVEQADLDYTLELVMSNGDTSETQVALISLLLEAGARATPQAVLVALAHGCFAPVNQLLAKGMPMTAPIAAALGRDRELAELLAKASPADRQAALGLAVINKRFEAARFSLDAGADPNKTLPVHKHSMPLHQAALNDDVAMLELLIGRGAGLEARDTLWNGTPLGWAVHAKRRKAEAYLRALQRSA